MHVNPHSHAFNDIEKEFWFVVLQQQFQRTFFPTKYTGGHPESEGVDSLLMLACCDGHPFVRVVTFLPTSSALVARGSITASGSVWLCCGLA